MFSHLVHIWTKIVHISWTDLFMSKKTQKLLSKGKKKTNKYMDLHVVLYVCAQRWNLDSTSYKEVEISTTTTKPALEYFGPTSVTGWTVPSRAAHILCGSVIGSDWAIHVSVRQARQLASASYTVYTTGVRYTVKSIHWHERSIESSSLLKVRLTIVVKIGNIAFESHRICLNWSWN